MLVLDFWADTFYFSHHGILTQTIIYAAYIYIWFNNINMKSITYQHNIVRYKFGTA
jgi:hypothetical protein